MALQVVWFKRDLRANDHAPLRRAAEHGPVLPLHVVEPSFWREPDASSRHHAHLAECLAELRVALAGLGQPLVVRVGEARDVLADLHREHGIAGLWSHQETGNRVTFDRDEDVAAWCRREDVPWREFRQNGVLRGTRSRVGWAERWETFFERPPVERAPALAPLSGVEPGRVPDARGLGLAPDPCPGRRTGGRAGALAALDGFLANGPPGYRRGMSSPVTAFDACSRLSESLTFGTISLREVVHATRRRRAGLADAPPDDPAAWRAGLASFERRLRWRCHFMQKLEDAPRMEDASLHPAFRARDAAAPDPARLAAWRAGETGYPMVDACMRALAAAGWLNFRMRAMLTAFASYHLGLPWRASGLHLARLFLDYEPGIHWPQCQMQSGVTGVHPPRIYNPTKQGRDQDPAGRFVRRWLPELASVPTPFVHEPWLWPEAARLEGRYPRPIVEHVAAVRAARERLSEARGLGGFAERAEALQRRHGGRAGGLPDAGHRRRPAAVQLSLDLAAPA